MDRIVFQMPDNIHEFMIAMAVVQEFEMQLIVGIERQQRDQDYTTTFRMDDKFKFFEPCLKVLNEHTPEYDYSGWNEWIRGDYDYFIDFDINKARNLAIGSNRHITESFGLLIGTFIGAIQYGVWPQKQPTLGPLLLKKSYDVINVLIMDWNTEESGKFLNYLRNTHTDFCITLINEESNSPEAITRCINAYDVVIGRKSATTYIAASLNRVVIEIFNDNEDYIVYNNDNLESYKAAIGNPSAGFMWSLWEVLWEEYQEHILDMKFRDHKIQTDSNQSIANNAEEKLDVMPSP